MADIKVEVKSNLKDIKEASDQSVKTALTICGLMAERYAKALCPVDTGRLRNSITHQMDGKTLMVGTNVEYAPYVELGTSKNKGPRPYIRPSIENHLNQYANIISATLKK